MRILHVMRSANPADGGPIEAVTRLGLEHERNGHRVELAAIDDPRAAWWRAYPLPWHALGPGVGTYGYAPRLMPWLVRNSPSFDVIVTNGLWQYSGFAVRRAARQTGTPYVVFPHGMLDPWFKRRYPLKHLKKWLYWPCAEYRILRDAAAVLFTSDEEQRQARHSFWLYRCTSAVVNYGTAAPAGHQEQQRQRFLGAFPAVAGTRPVLFLGRIHEKKGCDLLVRAFASALATAPASDRPWHLVLAGPGRNDRFGRRLERLVSETCPAPSVTWTGMLTGDLKWGAFRAADVFALPSHQENFGVAVTEALACGVPVLISDKVNIWRHIQRDGAGLVERDDADGTQRLLARWMSLDDVSREQMRARASRCFAQRFDVRQASERIAVMLAAIARQCDRTRAD